VDDVLHSSMDFGMSKLQDLREISVSIGAHNGKLGKFGVTWAIVLMEIQGVTDRSNIWIYMNIP